MEYIYPTDIYDFDRTTIYQIKDPVTREWSSDKVVDKLCRDKINMFILLIKRKGIRIIKNDK